MEGITWDWVQEPSAKTQMTNYLRATFGHITKRFDEMNEKSEQGSQIIVEFQKMSELFRARKMPAPLLKAAGERASSFGKCKACSFGATSHLRFLHLQCKGIHHRNMEHR